MPLTGKNAAASTSKHASLPTDQILSYLLALKQNSTISLLALTKVTYQKPIML